MTELRPVRELVEFYIGGGWGFEEPSEGLEEVAIIRGADFPRVAMGDSRAVPVRWEESKKVARRALREGDLVLEISGGTKDRPTGRSVFVSDGVLRPHHVPVIPASFCRLLRPDPMRVVPRYLYYWLQDMYRDGRTWGYQVQSTGLANFNIEWFLDRELVRVPPLDEQRRIAEVLGALDDLIDTNELVADRATSLAQALAMRAGDVQVPLAEIAAPANSRTVVPHGVTDHYSLPAFDSGRMPERVDGSEIKSSKTLIDGEAVLVSRLNPHIPRVWAVYPDPQVLSVASTEFVPMRGLEVSVEEVFALVSSESYLAQLSFRVTGTTGSHQRVDKKALVDLQVPDVRQLADNERDAIVDLVREGHASREMCAQLRRTRDELLPLLMSGAVRVKPEVVAA